MFLVVVVVVAVVVVVYGYGFRRSDIWDCSVVFRWRSFAASLEMLFWR